MEQILERVAVSATCRRVMEVPTIDEDIVDRGCAVDVAPAAVDKDETLMGRWAEGGTRKKRMLVGQTKTRTPWLPIVQKWKVC